MPKSAITEEIRRFQEHFEWSGKEAEGLTAFAKQWIQNEDKRLRLEGKRLAVLRARKILEPHGPFRYLGNASTGWQMIERELNECAASLEQFSDEQFMAVKNAKEMVEQHLQRIRNALSIRDLKEEVRDCQRSLVNEQISPKPSHMSARDWLIWNLAPFFVHTETSSREHRGKQAWEDLASFLLLFGHAISSTAVGRAFRRVLKTTRRDLRIANLLAKRQQHRSIPFRNTLHTEAFKSLSQVRSRSSL